MRRFRALATVGILVSLVGCAPYYDTPVYGGGYVAPAYGYAAPAYAGAYYGRSYYTPAYAYRAPPRVYAPPPPVRHGWYGGGRPGGWAGGGGGRPGGWSGGGWSGHGGPRPSPGQGYHGRPSGGRGGGHGWQGR